MFIEERHQLILDMLYENGSITTKDIENRFGISYDSAKRDLRILESEGKLRRTHGGAIMLGELSIGRPKPQKISYQDEKEYIKKAAVIAVEDIAPNNIVFISKCKIGLELAKILPEDKNLTVIVNSISVADKLLCKKGIKVIMLGGILGREGSICDSIAVEMIKKRRIDVCFLSADCISALFGLSYFDDSDALFAEALSAVSKKIIGLFEGEQIEKEASVFALPVSSLDLLIVGCDKFEPSLRKYETNIRTTD